MGHKGAYFCRLFCGIKGRRKPKKSRYYSALLKPDNYNVPGCDHPDIPVQSINSSTDSYLEKLQILLRSQNPTNYKTWRQDTGIGMPSFIHGLMAEHHLTIKGGFGGDSMHATTLNLGDILIPLWCGTFECAPTDNYELWDWAVLTGDVWKDHGRAVADA